MSSSEIIVLGAEQQAASSLALSYPERRFLFITDAQVIDGWDLHNVRIEFSTPEQVHCDFLTGGAIALSGRWTSDPHSTCLSALFRQIDRCLPGLTAPIHTRPNTEEKFIVKGDCWHRPDHPVAGTPSQLSDIVDRHGCGIVYQELLNCDSTFVAVGRRTRSGFAAVGLFHIFTERHFRIDFPQAGESIEDPGLLRNTYEVLDALNWEGWFALNWIHCAGVMRLSSVRIAPKGVFRCFRHGGMDLLDSPRQNTALRAGLRFVSEPHYSEFKWLTAC